MNCPEPDELHALTQSGAIADAIRARLVTHVEGCDACSAAVEVLLRKSGPAPCATAEHLTIGRYVIEAMLGTGGMGVVYRAIDPELRRVVAVKVLGRDVTGGWLRREAQALAKLDHPNVVAIYDLGTQDEMFIAMEYVDGSNLRQWLAQQPRRPAEILKVLRDAGRGVEAAHAVGLVHRDLKPDNIFVSRTGQVMVGDFGLVRDAARAESAVDDDADGDDAVDLTRWRLLGTPAYMAPEQAAGRPSPASDQFSFCVTAWEALTGQRPFAGNTVREILANEKAGRIGEPAAGCPLPRRIEAALRRGLAADPEARFASMTALLRVFEPRWWERLRRCHLGDRAGQGTRGRVERDTVRCRRPRGTAAGTIERSDRQ